MGVLLQKNQDYIVQSSSSVNEHHITQRVIPHDLTGGLLPLVLRVGMEETRILLSVTGVWRDDRGRLLFVGVVDRFDINGVANAPFIGKIAVTNAVHVTFLDTAVDLPWYPEQV